MTKDRAADDGEDRSDPVHRHARSGASVERPGAGRGFAQGPVAPGDEHGDRGDELAAAVEAEEKAGQARRRGRLAQFLKTEGEQHSGARDADRGDDGVIMRRRAGVRAVDQEAHDAAEREQGERHREREKGRIAPWPWGRRAAGADDKRAREEKRRRGDAELQQAERLALAVGERSESRVERRRRERDQRDEDDGGEEGAAVDRFLSEAHAREDRPVRHHQRRIDKLQHVAAAPEQFVARRELPLIREQRSGDRETDQRQNVDEAAKRHRDRERRCLHEPARQVDQEANDRRQHPQGERQKAEVIGGMANDRNVIGQHRLGGVEEGRREQAGKRQREPRPARSARGARRARRRRRASASRR